MRRVALIALLLLAACGPREPTAAEIDAAAERDIAAVKQAQEIPPVPITPQPILYPDIERNQLFGSACAFAPEGGGLGALVLAMEKAAYMKIDGEIVRLAPDAGSPLLPLGTRGKYDGRDYALVLDIAEGEGRQTGSETMSYDARLVVRNARDQSVYEGHGVAQCGS